MRPVDDSFGGQPVFNCRNVIQTTEDKIDGFEDDDENYYDDGKLFKSPRKDSSGTDIVVC